MKENPGNENQSSDRLVRLVKNEDAKSIFAMDSNEKIEKLNDAVEQLEEIEVLSDDYSDEEIQYSLMSNNYTAPEEEVKEETVEEEVVEEKKVNEKINLIKNKLVDVKEKARLFFIDLSKRNKKYAIVVVCLIVVLLSILFIKHEVKIHTYDIKLNGQSEISLYEGGLYKENGFQAFNYKGKNVTKLVKVKADVKTDKVGEYKVFYRINSIWKKNEIFRTVKVLPNPLDDIYFTLNGDEEIDVKLNSKFEDPGYSIRSNDNNDYTKYVTVSNNVNTSKIGTYEVNYLIRINKKKQLLTRKVNVTGSRFNVKFSNAPTKTKVDVNISSNLNNFDYYIVDGHKVLKDNIVYTVNDNGHFSVDMYDTYGNKDVIEFYVSNIDRTPPTGTCRALMNTKAKNTTFNLDIRDSSGVSTYKYNNQSFSSYTFTIKSMVKSGTVEVIDKAGNKANIGCNYLYGPINADASKKVLYRFDGPTMKYWVEKPTPTYLITHIWVEDPYNQFKVAVPKGYPQLERAGIIMNYASTKYGYYSKAMIGANASGIVSTVFNSKIGKIYPKWRYTSKSPLVIVDGKVLRNYSALKMYDLYAITFAMNSNGYLIAYNLTTNNKQANINHANYIIKSGAKYTFGFGPILVQNGKINNGLKTVNDVRQGIGQIDKNNFIIVTNTVGINHRSNGLSFKSLATVMRNQGCITAFNTDGGGSTNLIYKRRNTNTYSGIVTSTRDIADIMYFVEK